MAKRAQVTKKIIISFISFIFFLFVDAFAQESNPVFGSKVFFFQTDSVQLKRDFRTNRQTFDALDLLLDKPEIYAHIDSVLITGAASPVGSAVHNRALSIARVKAIGAYILRKRLGFDRSRIDGKAVGIDWEGFQSLVARDAFVPDKEKILLLSGRIQDEDRLLMELSLLPEATQQYLRANIFSRLQYVNVRFRMDDGSYIPALDGSPLRNSFVVRDTVIVRDTLVRYRTVPVNKRTKQRRYIGPTQAAVSIVYLIKK